MRQNRKRWNSFLKQYEGIIHGTPLEFSFTPIRHIAKDVVQRVDEPSSADGMDVKDFLFARHWKPIRFDGEDTVREVIDSWATGEDF